MDSIVTRMITMTALVVTLGACAQVRVRVRLPEGVVASGSDQVPKQDAIDLQFSSPVWPIRMFFASKRRISVEVPRDCMGKLGLSKEEATEAVQFGHNSLLIDVWLTSKGREWGVHDCQIDVSPSRLARAVLDGSSCELTPVSMPFATAEIKHATPRR